MSSLVVILFVSVVVIGIALLVVISLTRKGHSALNQEAYQSEWLRITSQASMDDSGKQLAIINADKLLDRALKELGVGGQNLGERMKAARSRFRDNDAVWRAHKLRNRIAHESNVSVSNQQVQAALAAFKRALSDLGAL